MLGPWHQAFDGSAAFVDGAGVAGHAEVGYRLFCPAQKRLRSITVAELSPYQIWETPLMQKSRTQAGFAGNDVAIGKTRNNKSEAKAGQLRFVIRVSSVR
jgi:hypothetical protein